MSTVQQFPLNDFARDVEAAAKEIYDDALKKVEKNGPVTDWGRDLLKALAESAAPDHVKGN